MTTRKDDASPADPVVLSIDVGGSHVKIMTSTHVEERRVESGPAMSAAQMVDAVRDLARGWSYDVISIGYPGPVRENKPSRDPAHLASGWVGYDFSDHFGKPVKVVNDALMQAIGSYEGGRMLFLGLGTGLGTAMILDNVCHPLEVGHLPFRKGGSFEDYVGEPALEKRGKKKWRKAVAAVTECLNAALLPDYIVIGGGNVAHLSDLPGNSVRGDNTRAFAGGFRIWKDPQLRL
ncbi:ROK family protein [Shinella oryzae]|uniref:ROK family protein n=1 Tax=Shinella oryzae TaxID=2871820 RepID=A0ABY9KG03_9HYPH|nr:ROK family protein [Shinella oryzae]WLS06186.1 ROK family protein [Shinella oryzae]